MAKKKTVKVVKKTLFNPAEIEQASGGSNSHGRVTKASVFRDFLTYNPDATFGPSKAALTAALAEHDLELKDTDAVPFGVAKRKLSSDGGINVGTGKSTGAHGGKEVTLKQFAALTSDIDPAMLQASIKIISSVGGVDIAKRLAAKWAELCEAIGEDNARKAIEVL
ncbi:MAG: hypothetical protein JWP89_1494 [Schlesneria sp.]|nr:hypothetical protein [Schlesneria sp.]